MVDTHPTTTRPSPGIGVLLFHVVPIQFAEYVDKITRAQNFVESVPFGVGASWLSDVGWIYWNSSFSRFLSQLFTDCFPIRSGVGKVCVFGGHILMKETESSKMLDNGMNDTNG